MNKHQTKVSAFFRYQEANNESEYKIILTTKLYGGQAKVSVGLIIVSVT